MPEQTRPFLRLSRYDRPIGIWLLALPGWVGLAFVAANTGTNLNIVDLKYAALIFIGAIAMRGAGCTYNDIVDRDLDKQVERTALRPLAAGTLSLKAAWAWLIIQCLVGLLILSFFPRFSQMIAIASLGLVAAYPFMKRITYWPQAWLGLTFNWAVLVAYSARTGTLDPQILALYFGLMFWTIGYDTIYACQDKEDDAMIGVKSTARLFGQKVKLGVGISYVLTIVLCVGALTIPPGSFARTLCLLPFALHLGWQTLRLNQNNEKLCLNLFKSNLWAALLLIAGFALTDLL